MKKYQSSTPYEMNIKESNETYNKWLSQEPITQFMQGVKGTVIVISPTVLSKVSSFYDLNILKNSF